MSAEEIKNLYRHDLSSFTQMAFRELHPHVAYQHNWHMGVLAHALAEVAAGNIKRLIINMPPRTLKSHCVSIAWPAWLLGRNPRLKALCLHGGRALGQSLEASCHALMSSRRYRALFPSTVIRQQKQKLVTGFGGYRQFMPIMGRLTGLGADIIIIDDPISPLEAMDDNERMRLNVQFDGNILQRLDNKKTGAIVLVMQRVHENDLTDYILSKGGGWAHINIPAVAVADETWTLPHGRAYTRHKGEILQGDREDAAQLIEILHSIGGYAFAYQYLQGLYKPKFGMAGEGGLWLSPLREGVFYDERQNPGGLHGAYYFKESDLILPKVFGIGEDPYPDNMRNSYTPEELEIAREIARERLRKHHEDQQKEEALLNSGTFSSTSA